MGALEMNQPTAEVFSYRPREAARLLGVSPTTLYKWIGQGLIEVRHIGNVALVPADQIRALLENASTRKRTD
jgi:excisionase family DNA binding protein